MGEAMITSSACGSTAHRPTVLGAQWWSMLAVQIVSERKEKAELARARLPATVRWPCSAVLTVSAVPTPPATLFGAICAEFYPVSERNGAWRAARCTGQVRLLTSLLNEMALECALHTRVIDAKIYVALADMRARGVDGASASLRCGLSRSAFRLVRRRPLLQQIRRCIERICAEHGVLSTALDAAYKLHWADPVVWGAVQGLRRLVGSGVPLGHGAESQPALLTGPPPPLAKSPPHSKPARCPAGPLPVRQHAPRW